MICLYRYEIPVGSKVESEPYLLRAVSEYLSENRKIKKEGWREKQKLLLSVRIEKTEKGKPVVRLTEDEINGLIAGIGSSELHVSATHTKHLVVCAVSDENIGIDCEIPAERQERKLADTKGARPSYERIAARFFTEREFS